jgi:hypothetical protein
MPEVSEETLIWTLRTAEAVRILDGMIEDRMLERDGQWIEGVCPKLWRPKPWDRKYTALRKRAQIMWDRDRQRDIRGVMERLDRALGEALSKPEGWEQAFILACLFIRARDALVDIPPCQ